MALGGTDLNLLVACEALLEEGSVTRAGRRLGMSQPAMSAALAKLRRRFADELLVLSSHGYDLTPTARELLPEVRRTLQLMQRALGVTDDFKPGVDERTFRVAMSDYAAAIFLEPLLHEIAATAPRVHLTLETLDSETWGLRHTIADLDALIAPHGLLLPGQHRPLWDDQMVLIADRSNPRLVDGRFTADDLSVLPHATGTIGRGLISPILQAFRDFGIMPHVTLQVTGYLALPLVVRGTDLVAAVPERLASRHAAADPELVVVPLPIPPVPLTEAYWFAENHLGDPANRWFYATVEKAAQSVI
jgi:DNA-binding transcriptional LysR family regulator